MPPPPDFPGGTARTGSRIDTIDRKDAAAVCKAYDKLELQYEQALRNNDITVQDYIEQATFLEKKNVAMAETIKKLAMDKSLSEYERSEIKRLYSYSQEKYQQEIQRLKQFDSNLLREFAVEKQERAREKQEYEAEISRLEEKVLFLTQELEMLQVIMGHPTQTNKSDNPTEPDSPAIARVVRSPTSLEISITKDEIKKEAKATTKLAPLFRRKQVEDDGELSYRSFFRPNGEIDHEAAIRYGQEEMERERRRKREVSEQAESISQSQTTTEDVTNAYMAVAACMAAASLRSQASNASMSEVGDHGEHAEDDEVEVNEAIAKSENISDFSRTVPTMEDHFNDASDEELYAGQASDDGDTVVNLAQKHGSSPPVSPDNKRARPSENEVLFNGKDFLRNFNREYNERYGLPSDSTIDEDSMIAKSDDEYGLYKHPASIFYAAESSHRDDGYAAEVESVLNGFRRCNDPESDSELHRVSVEPLENDAEGPMDEELQEEDDAISSHGVVLTDNDQVEIDSAEELNAALQDPLPELSKPEPEAPELSEEELRNVSAAGDDSFGRPVATSSPPGRRTEDVTPVHSFIQPEDPLRQAKVQELMRKNLVAFNVRKPSNKIDSRAVAEEAEYDAGNEADVEDLPEATSKGRNTTARVVPTEQEMAQMVADAIASGKRRRVQSHAPGCWVIDENSYGSAGDISAQILQSQNESGNIKIGDNSLDAFHTPSMLVPEPRIVTSSEEDSSESTKRGSPSPPGITDSVLGVPVSDFLGSLRGGTTAARPDPLARAKPTTPIKALSAAEPETTSPVSPPSAEDKITTNGVMLAPENHNPWEGKLQPHNLNLIREVSLRKIPEDVTLTQVLDNMKFGVVDHIDYDKSRGTVSVFYVEPVAAKACYTYLHRFGNWVRTAKPGPVHMEGQTMLELRAFLWSNQSLPVSPDILNLVKHGEATRVIFVTGLPYHFTDDDVKHHILSVSPPDTELDKIVESVQKIRSHAEIRFTSVKECLRVKQALKALPEYIHGTTLFGPDTCGGLQGQPQLLTKKFMKFRDGPQHIRHSSPESAHPTGSTLLMELTRREGDTPIKTRIKSETTANTDVPVVEVPAPGSPESLKFTDIDGLQQAEALKQAVSLDKQPKPSSQTASLNTVVPKIPAAPKAMADAPGAVRTKMSSTPTKNTTYQPGSRAVSFATKTITHNIEAVMSPAKAATWIPPPAECPTYCTPTTQPRLANLESMLEKPQGPAKLRPTLPTFKRPGTPAPKMTRLPSSKPAAQGVSGIHPATASFASVAARASPIAQVQGTESSFEERRGPAHMKFGPTNIPYAGFQNAEPSESAPASAKVAERVRTNQASVVEKLLPASTIENMKKFADSAPGPVAQKTADKPLGAKHWATQESIAIAAYRQATIKGKDEIKIPEARTLDFKAPDQYTETFHPRAVRLTNLPPEWGYDDLAIYVRGGAVDTMVFVPVSGPPTPARTGPPPGKAAVIIFVLQPAAEKFRAFIIKERVTPRPGYTLNADANLGVVPGVCVYSPEKVLRQELTRCLMMEGLPHGCTVAKLKNAINQLPANGEDMRFESIKVNGVCARIACTCISDAVFIMRNINRAKGYLGVRVQYAPDPCNGELWEMGRKNA